MAGRHGPGHAPKHRQPGAGIAPAGAVLSEQNGRCLEKRAAGARLTAYLSGCRSGETYGGNGHRAGWFPAGQAALRGRAKKPQHAGTLCWITEERTLWGKQVPKEHSTQAEYRPRIYLDDERGWLLQHPGVIGCSEGAGAALLFSFLPEGSADMEGNIPDMRLC